MNSIALVRVPWPALAAAVLLVAQNRAVGAFISEAYVAVQANDLSGPVVGTGPTEVVLSDVGVGTEAAGFAKIIAGGVGGDAPRPVKQEVFAAASVGDPGPAGDTGALTVASTRAVTHVHAEALSPVPQVTLAIVHARVTGFIEIEGPGADGTVYGFARVFDPLGIISPVQKDFLIDRTTTSQYLSQLLSLGVRGPIFARMTDYLSEGLALDLQVSVEAHAFGKNASAGLDFSGTMEIVAFNFYDAQGNFVPAMSVVDEFGARYPVNVNVPEAGGLWIMGCGLVTMVCVASRRGRRASPAI
jgi:hypothetical protein